MSEEQKTFYQIEFHPIPCHIKLFVLQPGEDVRRLFDEHDYPYHLGEQVEQEAIASILRVYPDAVRLYSAGMEEELQSRMQRPGSTTDII